MIDSRSISPDTSKISTGSGKEDAVMVGDGVQEVEAQEDREGEVRREVETAEVELRIDDEGQGCRAETSSAYPDATTAIRSCTS